MRKDAAQGAHFHVLTAGTFRDSSPVPETGTGLCLSEHTVHRVSHVLPRNHTGILRPIFISEKVEQNGFKEETEPRVSRMSRNKLCACAYLNINLQADHIRHLPI